MSGLGLSLSNCLPDGQVRCEDIMSELTVTKVYYLLLVGMNLEGWRRRIDLVASRIVRGKQYVKPSPTAD